MPETEVLLFAEDDGSAPLLDWLDGLPPKVRDKCIVRIEILGTMGHELRRPVADLLQDGTYELRVSSSERALSLALLLPWQACCCNPRADQGAQSA